MTNENKTKRSCRNCVNYTPSYKSGVCRTKGKRVRQKDLCEGWRSNVKKRG